MLKRMFSLVCLYSLSSYTMQPTAHVYDQERTNVLKSLLNAYDGRSKTPFKKIEELVVMGANPNVKADCGEYENRRWVDCMSYSQKESIACVSVMISHGAQLNDSSLYFACNEGEYTSVLFLLNYGANACYVNSDFTCLYVATAENHLGIAKLLLERGAASDIDKVCAGYYSPLSYARTKNLFAFLKLFEKYRNKS